MRKFGKDTSYMLSKDELEVLVHAIGLSTEDIKYGWEEDLTVDEDAVDYFNK